jgi:hypothetical protein
MKDKTLKYFIGLFLVMTLLFKATGTIIMLFSAYSSEMVVAELLMEQEQEENKGNSKAETGADELFEKALLPDCDYVLMIIEKPLLHIASESLQDVHLETLTPPPNPGALHIS